MKLLYTDARIVVCLKPAGVLSTDSPGGMPELLRRALGEGETGCVRTIHRLDQPVGGVMVFARSRMADSLLSQQVQRREFEKEYLAVLQGIPAAAAGRLSDYLRREPATRRTVLAQPSDPDARPAQLLYRLLGQRDGRSLVHIVLLTGRTHQIRSQFSARGLPLCGDQKYGAADDGPLGLWSYRLAFRHPQSGEPVSFFHAPPAAPPWDIFEKEIEELSCVQVNQPPST